MLVDLDVLRREDVSAKESNWADAVEQGNKLILESLGGDVTEIKAKK